MTRICCGILLFGSGIWGVLLLPFCLTPFVILLLPGYAIMLAYAMYLRHSHQWTFLARIGMWAASLTVHGGWLCLHLYEVAHGRLPLLSPAGSWWWLAVSVSAVGLFAEVTESVSEQMEVP